MLSGRIRLAVCIAASVVLSCIAPTVRANEPIEVLKAAGKNRWMQGNMHTHSHWSDGDDYPEMIALWYRDRGYQFLVNTDHNILHQSEKWIDVEKSKGGRVAFDKLTAKFPGDWVETRETEGRLEVRLKHFDTVFERLAVPQEFLLIQGEEISDSFNKAPIHLCVSNTTELLTPLGGENVTETIQRNVDAVLKHRDRTGQKSLVHLNHPNFIYAITAEQLMPVVGEKFFEVYNGHPTVHNTGDAEHASTERMWDIVNTWRLAKLDLPIMFGLATDDGHDYHRGESLKGSQPGRGWVMVLADTLTPDALVDSLEAGRFYSSSGVTLSQIAQSAASLTVEVVPQDGVTYRIDFIGTRKGFDETSKPASDDAAKVAGLTRVYSADVGATLKTADGTSATYEFAGDELYVRAVVTSSRLHPNPSEAGEFERAWVQPVVPGGR